MGMDTRMTDASPIRLVIFDFDGTLSDSFRTVQPDEVDMLRNKSSRDVIAFLGISRWKLPLIARHVRRLVGRNAHQIELFPGTPDLLEQIAATGVKIALVTSNAEANVRKILGPEHAARIDCFACGSSLFGKAPKFRRVLKKMGVKPGEVLAVGDETRDIDAAREVGMRAGSVLWGYAAEELLIAMRPDVLFRTPQDIIEHVAARR
jgi:phosphoglycolate phosphatase